ncbi:MAG: hypothetical protein AB8G22_22290, partial [Saprospiraceae bacterium]
EYLKKLTAQVKRMFLLEADFFVSLRQWEDAADRIECVLEIEPKQVHWQRRYINYLIKAGKEKSVWLPLVEDLIDRPTLPKNIKEGLVKLLISHDETALVNKLNMKIEKELN